MKVCFEKIDFELGEEVWVVCGPNHSMKTSIIAFRGMVINGIREKAIGIFREAKLSNLILEKYFADIDNGDIVPLKYLTKDGDKAGEWMKFYPVRMNSNEWLVTIGDRDIKENEIGNIENGCELGSCCADISNIRDCLVRCQEKGGIIGWEREDLQGIIDNSCHNLPENHLFLDRIFSQLNIKWEA